MKQLFYQVYFNEREDDLPLTTVCIRIPEQNVDDFSRSIKKVFAAGYYDEEIVSRDQWVEDVLNRIVNHYDGIRSYFPIDGHLYVE